MSKLVDEELYGLHKQQVTALTATVLLSMTPL